MATVFLGVFMAGLSMALLVTMSRLRRAQRAEYIRSYMFPPGLFDKLRQKRPELELKDCQLAAHALRQFFLVYLRGGRQFVSMPSQVVDDLWHEFILYTRNYAAFCDKAFNRFLHHTPAVVLGERQRDNSGLRRTWWYACLEENINPRHPTRLPLLFALDAKLNIADGFRYAPDCQALRRDQQGVVYCGADLSSSDSGSSDGSSHDASDSGSSDSGCSGGCGGGCGGGGD